MKQLFKIKRKIISFLKIRDNQTYLLTIITSFIVIIDFIIPGIVSILPVPELPEPSVSINDNVNLSYFQAQGMNNDNLYMLFNDNLNDNIEHFLEYKCATHIFITNYYDESIILKNIIFDAQEIVEDNTAYLFINGDMEEEYHGNISLNILNKGWGKLENATLTIECLNADLSTYFLEYPRQISDINIDIGETVTIPFLNEDNLIEDVLKKNAETDPTIYEDVSDIHKELDFKFRVESADSKVKILEANVIVQIYEDGLYLWGGGDASSLYYGVKISTKDKEFSKEESIFETIASGETLALPICFFPDRSCKMKFKIGFDILHNGEENRIYSDSRTLNFFISSYEPYATPRIPNDVDDYTKKELEEESIYNAVSFPYA